MQQLIENLKAFNRRERFFVVGWALDNPSFTLGSNFREQFERDTGIHIPADAFCAMDFSIDWIIGCLWLTRKEQTAYEAVETGEVNRENNDLDLVIAFESKGKTRLLLIEAKGVTGWHNKQLKRKAERLGAIFGSEEVGEKWPEVDPSFILASPKESSHIDVTSWPLWMKPNEQPRWLELSLPPGLRRIVRCREDGKRDANGAFWKVL